MLAVGNPAFVTVYGYDQDWLGSRKDAHEDLSGIGSDWRAFGWEREYEDYGCIAWDGMGLNRKQSLVIGVLAYVCVDDCWDLAVQMLCLYRIALALKLCPLLDR